MLRVGLTGDLGSGKSTVARMLAKHGAFVLSSDDMGRAMMQPGQAVYAAIVQQFGNGVVQSDGTLDRRELARMAFTESRVEELNAIVHPAVITEQARILAELEEATPETIAVVESALIFSTTHSLGGAAWQERFDRILLVTSPESTKLARFVERASEGRKVTATERGALEADARRRLAAQASTQAHESECLVIHNDGDVAALQTAVDGAWAGLQKMNASMQNR